MCNILRLIFVVVLDPVREARAYEQVEKRLANRTLKIRPLDHADLESTTLAKACHVSRATSRSYGPTVPSLFPRWAPSHRLNACFSQRRASEVRQIAPRSSFRAARLSHLLPRSQGYTGSDITFDDSDGSRPISANDKLPDLDDFEPKERYEGENLEWGDPRLLEIDLYANTTDPPWEPDPWNPNELDPYRPWDPDSRFEFDDPNDPTNDPDFNPRLHPEWVNLPHNGTEPRNKSWWSGPLILNYSDWVAERMPKDDVPSLFHALAHGLKLGGYADQDDLDGWLVRERIADFIADNPDELMSGSRIQAWVEWYIDIHDLSWPSGLELEEYANDLADGKLPGGTIELRVFCNIWRVNVNIYQSCKEGWWRIEERTCHKYWALYTKPPQGVVRIVVDDDEDDPNANIFMALVPDKEDWTPPKLQESLLNMATTSPRPLATSAPPVAPPRPRGSLGSKIPDVDYDDPDDMRRRNRFGSARGQAGYEDFASAEYAAPAEALRFRREKELDVFSDESDDDFEARISYKAEEETPTTSKISEEPPTPKPAAKRRGRPRKRDELPEGEPGEWESLSGSDSFSQADSFSEAESSSQADSFSEEEEQPTSKPPAKRRGRRRKADQPVDGHAGERDSQSDADSFSETDSSSEADLFSEEEQSTSKPPAKRRGRRRKADQPVDSDAGERDSQSDADSFSETDSSSEADLFSEADSLSEAGTLSKADALSQDDASSDSADTLLPQKKKPARKKRAPRKKVALAPGQDSQDVSEDPDVEAALKRPAAKKPAAKRRGRPKKQPVVEVLPPDETALAAPPSRPIVRCFFVAASAALVASGVTLIAYRATRALGRPLIDI